jgi:hypothetical protein
VAVTKTSVCSSTGLHLRPARVRSFRGPGQVLRPKAAARQSTGITCDLGNPSKWLLSAVMYGGRIGPVLFATALAMTTRKRHYRYPETRPLVG